MQTQPLVSVLTTAFNREKYIGGTIESVLASTYKNFELIIVDDCSTDDTIKIARKNEAKDDRIKVFVNEKNLGDYPNRNKAASYAMGKYIKYLDSDDIIYPHGLEVMVNSMEQFPEAGFGLSCKKDNRKPFPFSISPKEIYLESMTDFDHFWRAPGSSIIRKDVFEAANGFSVERLIGDLEFWVRISRKHGMVKLPDNLYWSRIHSGQELQSAEANGIYDKRTRELIQLALSHPECPLDDRERKFALQAFLRRRKKKKTVSFLVKLKNRILNF